MILESIDRGSLYRYLASLFLAALTARLLHNKYGKGINSVPGPPLAPFSDLWRFIIVAGRRPELKHIEMHQKYGKVVRLGPSVVSVSDPDAIKIIYGINAGFVKVLSKPLYCLNSRYHTYNTSSSSPDSTLFSNQSQKTAPRSKDCLVPRRKNTTPSYGEQSRVHTR